MQVPWQSGAAAKQIRCTNCWQAFSASESESLGIAAAVAPKSRKTPSRPKGSSAHIWIIAAVAIGGVGLLCLGGVGGVAAFFLMRKPTIEMAEGPKFVAIAPATKEAEKARELLIEKDVLPKNDERPLDGSKDLKTKGAPTERDPARDRKIIRDVMRKAMGKGAGRDFMTGKATEAQKQQLTSLMADFATTRSPRGNDADWNARTSALLTAVKANDAAAFKKASDCAGCHSLHRKK
jgi:hypothetical protein